MNRWIGLTIILLITTACAPVEEAAQSAVTEEPTAASPQSSPLESPLPPAEESATEVVPLTSEEQVIKAAKELLSARKEIPFAELELKAITAVDWPNSCLGCAEAGENCLMVITPGYQIILTAGDAEYEVHTDAEGKRARICEGFSAPPKEEREGKVPDKVWEQQKAALAFLQEEQPGLGLQQLAPSWSGAEVTEPGLLGAMHYRFTNADWTLRLVCPVVPEPICTLALQQTEIGQIWAGEVTAQNVVRAATPAPTLSYQVGGCDQELTSAELEKWPAVELEATTEGFRFNQRITYTCCADIVPAVSLNAETQTIYIIESNLGEVCRCNCGYELQGEVTDISPGNYRVEFWGIQKEGLHPLTLLATRPWKLASKKERGAISTDLVSKAIAAKFQNPVCEHAPD